MSPSQSTKPIVTAHEPLLALREVRESAGLHIAALAAALKVPVRKLEALEAGRYEELPDLTFARALASSACRHLKADPKPVLDQIPMRQSPALGAPANAIGAPFKPSVPGAVSSASSSWLARPSVIVAGALILAAAALLLLPEWERLSASLTSASSGTETPAATAPSETIFPPASPKAGSAEASGAPAEPPAEPVAAVETEEPLASAPAQPPAETTATAGNVPAVVATGSAAPATAALASAGSAEQPGAAASILYIAATGESWVEVTNGAGAVVAQRLLKPGDVIEFSASPPYKVLLGRAEAAKVLVRGQPFDVMPFARNSVARFEAR